MVLQYFKFREKRRLTSSSLSRTPRLLLGSPARDEGEEETLAEAFGLPDESAFVEVPDLQLAKLGQFVDVWKSAGEALIVADALTARIVDVNPQAVQLLGLPRSVLQHMTQTELHPLREREEAMEIFLSSSSQPRECHILHASGELVPVDLTSTDSLHLSGRRVVITSLHPTSKRAWREEQLRRLNRALRAVYEATKVRLQAASEAELHAATCIALAGGGQLVACWIAWARDADAGAIAILAAAGQARGYIEDGALHWLSERADDEPTATAIAEGRLQMAAHLDRNTARQRWKQSAGAHGIGALLALPLFQAGKAVAAITLCTEDTAEFSAEEISLFQQFAEAHMAAATRLRTAGDARPDD